jgi:7,8-dihydropterin-6-yl-methyl-4-(beta-D-ribofuranosyl)aminobenzene 5'-phosphate synthase
MNDRMDIGAVRDLKIDVLTETGWFDDARFKEDMAAGGGSEQTQYKIAWDAENAGGYAALLTVTLPGGDQRKILLDTGWNTGWMDYVFARHGVDAMLERGEIDFMVLSHWHLDHFWGIESTLKHNPKSRSTRRPPGAPRTAPCCRRRRPSAPTTATGGPSPSARTTCPTREN